MRTNVSRGSHRLERTDRHRRLILIIILRVVVPPALTTLRAFDNSHAALDQATYGLFLFLGQGARDLGKK